MGFWADLWKNMRTWVSDWYKSDVLKDHLKKQALDHREPVNKELFLAHGGDPAKYKGGQPAQPTDQELFNEFMFSGVDYRGQAQHAFETLGYGGGVTIGVDLAKMFVPPGVSSFVTASVQANFSAKRASHRFLFVSNQGKYSEFTLKGLSSSPVLPPPSRPGEAWRTKAVTNLLDTQDRARRQAFMAHDAAWQPVVMSCMIGKWTNLKGGLGVTVGVTADTTNAFDIGIGDIESFGFAINLTASASAGLDGTWVFATDPAPSHTKDRKQMQEWFTEHLKSTTSAQKVDFKKALAEIKMDANPSCYLSWWVHSTEASAGLSAKVSATAATSLGQFKDQAVGPGGTLSLSAKLPSVKWTAKTSSYRLNNPCPHPDLVASQETKILYKQVGGQLFGLAMELELGCAVVKSHPATYKSTKSVGLADPQDLLIPQLSQKVDASPAFSGYSDLKAHGGSGKTKVSEKVTPEELTLYRGDNLKATLTSKSLKMAFLEDKFKKLEKNWEVVNSMYYESGIAMWSKSDGMLREGSGFVAGQSVTLPSLVKFWSNFEECRKLFNTESPDLGTVRQFVQDSIKKALPTATRTLPRVEDWIESTSTGQRRWNIKSVDEALRKYWKHMDASPWKDSQEALPGFLLEQAERNCSHPPGETPEARARRVCGMLIYIAEQEARTRQSLFMNIQSETEEWIKSKKGLESAKRNGRWPGVASLIKNYNHEWTQLDEFASSLDVCKEYLEARTLEAGLAKSLHVSAANLRTFLSDKGLQGAARDIINLARFERKQVPGAFLIEASFKLPAGGLAELSQPANFKPGYSDLQSGFTETMKKKLSAHFDNCLQYLSLRYRKADTAASNRSFKLGVNVGVAQFGFSLDRVRQAGTEGNFMVSTVWFGHYKSANQSGGWPEKTVPMPAILS